MTLNNKTKTILFTVLVATLMVPLSEINVSGAVNGNTSSTELNTISEIPAAPSAIGCYHYTKGTSWVNVPCATAEETKNLPHPTIGGQPSGVYAIRDSANTVQSYGKVDVKFSAFAGESDTTPGVGTVSNKWSIQTNTNTWVISGTTWWAQFVEQNDPSTTWKYNCIWQNNLSTQDYTDHVCISVPLQTLSSSFEGYVEGKTITNNNLSSQYCNVGANTQCWLVTTADRHQLHTNWTSTSGTMLGMGGGGTANFVSTSTDVTQVTTGPATTAATFTDTTTNEMNNMAYGADSSSCAFSLCTRTSTSTK